MSRVRIELKIGEWQEREDWFLKMSTFDEDIKQISQDVYDVYWKTTDIIPPDFWPHWQVIKDFKNKRCLEIGPGTRPKIPIKNNFFLDQSKPATDKLNYAGGKAVETDLKNPFPFPDNYFDLICCFEVLEHLENYQFVLKEISRTLRSDGTCLISFPLNRRYFTFYDKIIGHLRRFEPAEIEDLFRNAGLKIGSYSPMQVSWPGKIGGYLLGGFILLAPMQFFKLQERIEKVPYGTFHKPLEFKDWQEKSYIELKNATNALFILMPVKGGPNQSVA